MRGGLPSLEADQDRRLRQKRFETGIPLYEMFERKNRPAKGAGDTREGEEQVETKNPESLRGSL